MSMRSRLAGRPKDEQVAIIAAIVAADEEVQRQVKAQSEADADAQRRRLATPDYTAPAAPQPRQLALNQVTELGTIATGNLWFVLADEPDAEFEVRYDGRAIPDRGPLMLSGGETYLEGELESTDERTGQVQRVLAWWPCRRWPAGSFANGGKLPRTPVPDRKQKPLAAVDGLAILGALAPRQPEIVRVGKEREEPVMALPYGVEPIAVARPRGPNAQYREGRGPVRGVASILKVLRRAGVDFVLSTDGRYAIPRTPGGGLDPGLRQVVDRAAPLVAAHLRGEPLSCVMPGHEDAAPEAVTIAEGGAPVCGEHVR